jgi:WD40 repeat protein/DNA-binding SARP family transcriptional activator
MVTLHALGPVRATLEGSELPVGGPRQRRLLAVLLVHRNRVVSTDHLIDAVFTGAPTAGAATTLRSYVARLRRVLGAAGHAVQLETRAPGYLLHLPDVAFDIGRFETDVAPARSALRADDPVRAAETLGTALQLWRGEPYAEFADEEWVYPEVQRLLELRLVAQELLVDAELARGRAREVVAFVEGLCAEHPLREAYRAQLMTAYYGSGRQADALASYRQFRAELAAELGIDPSPALAELEVRILAQDPTLPVPAQPDGSLRGYLLGERLGTGRDGTVRVARLPDLDRAFAIKTMRASIADDPGFIRSFEATALKVASLRHPGVLPLHDYWREPGAAHVVMPRLSGGTLRERLQRHALEPTDVLRVVEQIGGALAAASDAGVAHGRVCGESVLYDGAGEPHLADFWLGQPGVAPDAASDSRDFAGLLRECLARANGISDGIGHALDDFAERGIPGIGELTSTLVKHLAGHPADTLAARPNPYRGLRAFDEPDAGYYFGRESLVETLVERLGVDSARLLVLVGASGTGKSSVVRAGLLPRLRAGAVPGSQEWLVATMVPGPAPFRALAEALRRIATSHVTDGMAAAGVDALVQELRNGPACLHRVLSRLLPSGSQAVLLVDQLEEMFTLAPDEEQKELLAAIALAVSVRGSRLRVIATLRADFYARPLAIQPFGALVDAATVAIPAMMPAEVEAAVVEPARRAGRTVEHGLVAELVGGIAAEPLALPALQFVLFELAERSTDGTLRTADYEDLGGLDGAIAARAEELYQSLGEAEKQQVREMFEGLVVVDHEGQATRRRTVRADLAVEAGTVDRWSRARLLTLDVHPQNRMPTVEVAHEALVREWPRLREWIKQDHDELVVLARLREAAVAWADLGREPTALYRGTSLEAALDVSERRDLTELEHDFVSTSERARERHRQKAADLIRRQARTNRTLRLQVAGIGVALLIALVGGVLALDQRGAAVRERHIAVARELAAAADGNLADDPERSILLALAAVDATRKYDEPVLTEAKEALHRAVTSSRVLLSVPGVGGTMDWTADGRYFTTEGTEETGIVGLYDARSGERVRQWKGDAVDLNDVDFSADGHKLATSGDDGAVKVWAVPSGRHLRTVALPGGREVWGPALNADGSLVAASWWAGLDRVLVARTDSGRVVLDRHVPLPEDTEFSPDGRRLAVVSERENVFVFDLASGGRLFALPGPLPGVRDVAWSPDGHWLAAATAEGAFLYDAASGAFRAATSGQIAEVPGVAWSRDSRLLATAGQDGTAQVHVVDDGGLHQILTLSAQDLRNGVRSVAFSPDGTRLMTSDWAVTAVKVWDLRTTAAAEIRNFEAGTDGAAAVAPAPDGRSMYLHDDGTRIRRVDLSSGQVLRLFATVPPEWGEHIISIAPSPDGGLVAASTDRERLLVWDTRTGRLVHRLGAGWHADWVETGAWSPDGRLLVVSAIRQDAGGSAYVLDRGGVVVGQVRERSGVWMSTVDFHGGDTIVTARRNVRDDPAEQQVRIWNWRTRRVVRDIGAHAFQAADDPTGRLVASARLIQGLADVWDRRTGRHVATLAGHTGPLTDIVFDEDGRRIATASTDGTARIWDARSGTMLSVLRGPVPAATGQVAFVPGGKQIVTTGYDGVVRVWTLDVVELEDIARHRLTRGLTTPECVRYLHTAICPASLRTGHVGAATEP